MNSAGTLFVSASNRIAYINPDSTLSYFTPTPVVIPRECMQRQVVDGTASACFRSAGRMAIDSAGNLYVEDVGYIRRVSPTAEVRTIANLRPNYSNDLMPGIWVRGIAVDAANNVYVAGNYITYTWPDHYYRGALIKITPEGVVTRIWEEAEPTTGGGTGLLRGVGFDAAQNLYFLYNDRVYKGSPSGPFTPVVDLSSSKGSDVWGQPFRSLQGMAVDSDGTIYLTDSQPPSVLKITPDGVVTTVINGYYGGGITLIGGRRLAFTAEEGIFELRVP